MSEIDTSTLVLYRSLSNGGYLMRTPGDGPWRLVLYSPHGQVMGEVMRSGQAAVLLGLTPADFGESQPQGSPKIVSVPVEPRRASWWGRRLVAPVVEYLSRGRQRPRERSHER
jgi:hypothetical protein